MTDEERFLELFKTAINWIGGSNMKPEHIEHSGPIAHQLAKNMMPFSMLPGQMRAPERADLPDLVPQGATVSSLGAQFAGWPEAEIRATMAIVQQMVLGVIYGASKEQLESLHKEFDESVAACATKYQAMQQKKQS